MPSEISQVPNVSILGLVDKGLRHPFPKRIRRYSNGVSILGLVDKGLRLQKSETEEKQLEVSILGLVDKGLRQHSQRSPKS